MKLFYAIFTGIISYVIAVQYGSGAGLIIFWALFIIYRRISSDY